jgi:class 3 adenylate cyclase/tetratricopeptide (TPR) repeat protein
MSASSCAACGFANPAGALFCGNCGTALGRPCPSCGTVVSLELAYCTSCGASLEEEQRVAAEERKFVTAVFVDLVGFTGRSERLDPEDVRAFLAPYHVRAKAELERFGGTVEKFIGDAVVAVFGAPTAHEDDAERAVRATLAVRDAISELNADDPSLGLSVRVGAATGEALVNLNARPEQGEQLAAGDVLNTASRLQSAAPPDGILVDEATRRATEHVIDYRAAEPVQAKGKVEPVPVWEPVAPKARLGVDIAFRGGAPLVGRTNELKALVDAVGRARRERTAQLVTLVGEPGIGKSRLVYELWSILEADQELTYWRQGRSLPYGEGVSFWALGEMAKAHAGILESDDAREAEEKLHAAVAQALPDPGDARWVEEHLRPLVGLGARESGESHRGEAFAAWRRFLESLAEQRPLVLVFEDLHWADDGLLDFVDQLVDWATGVPLVVVCTTRPELVEHRPGWGGGKRNAATLTLAPLSDAETEELVTTLVGELHPDLLSHAGGNPLYAEEYVRMLAQRANGGDLTLPESVQGIIAARLDTLPAEEKALVQDASVLGKVFWFGELTHVAGAEPAAVDARLRALERKEFVRRERRSSVSGETAYVFRHALVRDVAYSAIPRGRRADKHRLAAEWVDSLAGDRKEDLADMVAHHYSSALELARAAGTETSDLVDRTRLALREAGDRAAGLGALEPAERYYREALTLWPDDEERPRLLLQYGKTLQPRGLGADILREAAEELLDAGDLEQTAEAHDLLGQLLYLQRRPREATEHFESAVRLLADRPPSRAKASVLAGLARFRMTSDRAAEAIAIGSEALAMAEELGLEELQASALDTLGICRVMDGDRDGVADIQRAIDLSRESRNQQLARGLNNLASTLIVLGDLEGYELYEESFREAERLGWTAALLWVEAERADAAYHRGNWKEAFETTTAILRSGERHVREVDAHVLRALMFLARDDTGAALEDSSLGLELGRESADPQILFPALAVRARVLSETGSSQEVEGVVAELFDAWRASPSTFASSWLAYVAPVAAAVGRGDEVGHLLESLKLRTLWLEAALALVNGNAEEAAQVYARMGSLPDEAHTRLLAGVALAEAGRRPEADEQLQRALTFFRSVQAARYVREAEALLAAS